MLYVCVHACMHMCGGVCKCVIHNMLVIEQIHVLIVFSPACVCLLKNFQSYIVLGN